MDEVEVAVIGAGVVGLAVARALALAGREVVVLEEAAGIGTGVSSRNSEVIHAGLYYPPGSLKARLCVEGKALLYAFARRHGVPHRRLGKLVVATDAAQASALDAIAARARACGVHDLQRLSRAEAQALEPALACTEALLSPSTGIVDSHALMVALQGEAEAHGAAVVLRTRVVAGRIEPPAAGARFLLETEDAAGGQGFRFAARHLVNAAGLGAQPIAALLEGFPEAKIPLLRLARGSYFAVPGRPAFRHLVYPVPEPGGLGVHLTLDMAGAMRFGPDVEWVETADYRVSDARRNHFEREIRRYWPALPADSLHAVGCGIRPKLSGPGEPAADFLVQGPAAHGIPGLVNLFGIESPGLTASLALAAHVADELRR